MCIDTQRLDTTDSCSSIRGPLFARSYLHSQNIVHRDLKPENLLLKSAANDSDIKIADFGFATSIQGRSLSLQCGSPDYVAPEIIKKHKYGVEVDMWSCGVIVYILLGGYPPFHEEEPDVLWGKIEAGSYAFHEEFWSQVSDAAKDLIQNLLVVDPDNRYSASQALRHPWFFEDDKALSMNAFDTGNLRKFNAKRKLKGTVKMVILANRLAKSNQSQEPSPVQKDQ